MLINEFNSSIDQFGTDGPISIKLAGIELDPNPYDQWLQAVRVIQADPNLSTERGLEVFKAWSKQATTPNDDAQCAYVFYSMMGGKPEPVAEIMPIAAELTLLEKLNLFLLPAARANAWPGFNETIQEAIKQLTPVPVTPFDAATATTIELVQRGLLSDEQAAGILANHPAFQSSYLQGEDVFQYIRAVTSLQNIIHSLNRYAGWWSDLETGLPKERNDGELLILVISEIIEGFEGIRKNLMDDKLFTRKMIEVEIADAFIRMADYAGGRNLDVAGAILHKLVYNTLRQDHTVAHRKGEHGKKM